MSGSWRRLVLANPDLPEGIVDHRAYALSVLERLYLSLRRRDVYAAGGSRRWGDPRARLLDGNAWEQTRPQVLTALRLTEPAETHLTNLAGRLDAAYTGLAARFGPPDERGKDATVRLEPGADGRVRLHLARLEALDEPPTLLALRELVARMLPRVDPCVLRPVALAAPLCRGRRALAGRRWGDVRDFVCWLQAGVNPQRVRRSAGPRPSRPPARTVNPATGKAYLLDRYAPRCRSSPASTTSRSRQGSDRCATPYPRAGVLSGRAAGAPY